MHTMPAARPSRPSTKLTALMVMTTRATVSRVPCHWVSATVPTPGIGQPQDRQTLHDHHAGGDHLPAELDQGVDLELVVQDADQPDQRGAGEQRPGLVGVGEDLVEVLQVVGDQQARAQAEEHGDTAEPRSGLPVHVACPDLRHRSGHDRELPYRPGQQVGHRGRDAERQQVFTHGLPHRSRWPSQPHTLAMGRVAGRGLPGGDDGCTACGLPHRYRLPLRSLRDRAEIGGQRAHLAHGPRLRSRPRSAAGQQRGDPRHLRLPHALGGHGGRAEPEAAAGRRAQARSSPAPYRRPRAGRARSRPSMPSGAGSATMRWVSVPPVVTVSPARGQRLGQHARVGDRPGGRTRRTRGWPPRRTRRPWRRCCASGRRPG